MDSLFSDPKVDVLIEVLHLTPGWPADGPKDDEFARRLIMQYPSMDLPEEIRRWQGWLMKHPEKCSANANFRSKVVTWLRQGVGYGLQKREQGRGEAGKRRPHRNDGKGQSRVGASTTAGGIEAFGETGRLEHW